MNLEQLKEQPRWLCHKGKVPKNPHTGGAGSSTDPKSWTTYAEAKRAVIKYGFDGVGIVFNGDGLVGIDLDKCITDNGFDEDGYQQYLLSKYARHVLYQAESYAEVSPSKTGIHIIGTGKIPRSFKDTVFGSKVEIYATGRYFTFTEDFVGGDTDESENLIAWPIRDIQDTIDNIFDDFAAAEEEAREAAAEPVVEMPITADTTQSLEPWIRAVVNRKIDHAVSMVRDATDGSRHHTRFRAARLVGGYLEAAERSGVFTINDTEATNMLFDAQKPAKGSEKSERQTIKDGLEDGRANPVVLPMPPEPVKPIATATVELAPETTEEEPIITEMHLTDLGNGLRMLKACKDRLCYVPEWKQWLVWDGLRWTKNDKSSVAILAHRVALSIYDTISAAESPDDRKKIAQWAQASESAMRIDAMIKSAQPYLTKSAELFDTHTDIIVVKNGILDLRTGTLSDHDREKYMTKALDIPYIPTAKAPRFLQFLSDVLTTGPLITYVQRMMGYLLTGRTDEHCLFFLYGMGKNGKSTFLEAVRMLLGDYYTVTNVEALLSADFSGGATPYVAALAGMRCAMASEMPEGRRFNESLVKDITGGGTITARTLYGAPFQFQPSHKLLVSGNHRPRITGTDEGIWRRLRVIPFTQTIEKPRPMLDIMNEFTEELPGILAWAAQGARLWYSKGMPPTDEIETATMEYRGEEDVVARFIAACCVMRTDARGEKHRVYEEWLRWTEDENELGANKWALRRFTEALKRKGVDLGGQGNRFYIGIGLLDK